MQTMITKTDKMFTAALLLRVLKTIQMHITQLLYIHAKEYTYQWKLINYCSTHNTDKSHKQNQESSQTSNSYKYKV